MNAQDKPAVPTLELPRRRRRRVWWIVLIAVVAATGAWGVTRAIGQGRESRQVAERLKTYAVEQGGLHVTVTESGTLKAKNSKRLWPDIQGRAKVAWLVEEGITVDSGDVLVIMETEDLEKAIADATIQLQQDSAARFQAETQLDIQQRQNRSDLQAAQVKLRIADLELQRYQEGEVPKLLRQADLALDRAQVDKRLADDDLVGMKEYVAKGYFTKQDHEHRKLALREAVNALETAAKELTLLTKFQIPKDLAQRQSDVDQAKTNLDLVTRKAESERARKQADLSKARFVEQLRRDRLTVLQERLKKMVIRAPQRGLVIYGDDRRWWRRDEIQVGMDVSRGRVILTLPDLDEMEVQVSINEVDLDKVQVGQSAAVVLDAYTGLTFRGRVTSVGKLAERQGRWSGSDIKTFEVIVELDMPDARRALSVNPKAGGNGGQLRPGMSAKVEIDVATLTNVLSVPIDAVFEDRGEHFCYVLVDGEPVLRPVAIGLSNPTHVHIKTGLSAGERVLRYDPRHLAGRRRPTTRPAGERGRRQQPATPATTRPSTRPTQGEGSRGGRPRGPGGSGRRR